MIINHIVSGQEEGNARLIVETNSGVIARSPTEVVTKFNARLPTTQNNGANGPRISVSLSRPRASLDIAEFLMSL